MGLSSQKLDALHMGAVRACIGLGLAGMVLNVFLAYDFVKNKPYADPAVKDGVAKDPEKLDE